MTDLTERLRYAATSRPGGICEEAANEIDHLTLDLQTERAAVVALTATIAGLRESANLRVRYHAAELADVTAERDLWKDTLAQRDRELANARAIDVHSCGPTCTRAGCVAGRLREEVAGLREQVTAMREICKLGFRALDAAGSTLLAIEPELSTQESESMSDLLQQVHDVAMSLFTVARLPPQEAARAFYGKPTP